MDNSYKEFLDEKRKTENAVVHKFRMNTDPDGVHIFYEGLDDGAYYSHHIRQVKDEERNIHLYLCKGKKNLRKVKSKIESMTKSGQLVLFFVDRDFDDYFDEQIKPSHNLYVTDGYSIENSILSSEAMEIAICDISGLDLNQQEKQNCRDCYERKLREFERTLLNLTAWLLANREIGNKPNLQNIKLNDVVLFSLDGNIKQRPNARRCIAAVAQLNGNAPQRTSIEMWKSRLKQDDPAKWMRGKFLLWFFCKYLEELLKTGHKLDPPLLPAQKNLPQALTKSSLLTTISSRVAIPTSLKKFLEHHIIVPA